MTEKTVQPVLGENIEKLRIRAGLTQPELGFLFGLHTGQVLDFTTISAHENNRRGVTAGVARVYARIFKVSVRALYEPLPDVSKAVIFPADHSK